MLSYGERERERALLTRCSIRGCAHIFILETSPMFASKNERDTQSMNYYVLEYTSILKVK